MSGDSWRHALGEFRNTQSALMRAAPYRDTGLVPNPAATADQIVAAEARLGHRLPPSYREFLQLHNGWPRFFEGASMLSASELGTRSYETLARAAIDEGHAPASTEHPEDGVPRRDAKVAPDGEFQASGDRMALYRCDDRFRQHHVARPHGAAFGLEPVRLRRAEGSEVRPGAEAAAGAVQHGDG